MYFYALSLQNCCISVECNQIIIIIKVKAQQRMRDTPPPILNIRRVAPTLLTLLTTMMLSAQVDAIRCIPRPNLNYFGGGYIGWSYAGVVCPNGQWNEGCGFWDGYGCNEVNSGYYAQGGYGSQPYCSAGYFSSAGSYHCIDIGYGVQCVDPAAKPFPCPDGFYAIREHTSYKCQICPASQYCPSAIQWPVSTSGNQWTVKGRSYYSTVGPGQMLNSNSQPPINCASKGYYWDGYTTCYICPAGYACPNSQHTNGYIQCPAGTYSAQQGQFDCTPCPPGSYCPSAGLTAPTPCDDGTYSLGYATSCTSCPAGYACPTASKVPVLCGPGQRANGGETICHINNNGYLSDTIAATGQLTTNVCTAGQYYVYNGTEPLTRCNSCPIGHYCDDMQAPPKPCPSGYYADTMGNTACTICPANSACAFPHLAPVTCPNNDATNGVHGYAAPAGSTSCYPVWGSCTTGQYKYPNPSAVAKTCPEGYACNYCFAPPQLCPRGYYSAAGAATCTLCEAGYMCPTPYASMRQACTDGYYSAAGMINCYPVPDHMKTTSVATRPGWCKYGEYSALASSTCTTCPAGSQCLHDSLPPIDCDAADDDSSLEAFTSLDYELSCFPKLAGRSGGPLSAAAKYDVKITAGNYGQRGGATQFECPMGRECLWAMENIFIQCPPGTYDQDNKFHCQPCPEGKVCPIMQHQYIDNSGTSGNVQNRFFSPYGTHMELMIPAGWYTDASVNYMIRPCALGYYSADGATGSCTICPIGYACPFGSNEPIRCDEGREAATTGLHECTPCRDDYWFNPTTQLCEIKPTNTFAIHPIFAVQACNYNQKSDSTSLPLNNYVDCVETDGRYYIKSSDSYVTCPNGFYCLHSGWAQTYTKFPCPPGTYGLGSTGSQTIGTGCQYCPAGSYCAGGTTAPVTCPAGYICPQGTQFATQFPCPLSTMLSSTGASSYTQCTTCTSGKLCLEGTETAFECPPGQNCGAAPWLSGDCQSGQYSPSGSCLTCPAGHFCVTGSSYAMKCPAGTYTSSTGAKSRADCIQAPANSPIPKYGQSATPTDYATVLGYVYPAGTAFSHQLPCPAGQVCNSGTLAGAWSNCPANFACPQGSSTTTAPMCERGYRCPAGTLDSRQFPQSTGYYTQSVGQTAIQCPAGFYCPAGTQRPRHCPLGYYCEAGTEDFRDKPCPIGTYGKTIQLTASSQCTACPAGHYCQPGLHQPQLCPAGTFSTGGADSAFSTTGLSFGTPCTQCTAGSFCPFEGTTAATACGVGFFSPPGSKICFRCYPGYKCDTTTNSQAYMEANKCTGMQCLTYAVYEWSACPSGYYCDESQFKPLPCPVGTYQKAGVSQATIAACEPVTAGYYNDEVGQNLTQVSVKLCSPGYTCAAGSISRYATPCPPGQYQDESGKTACKTCPEGYYCLGATVHPIPCPGGQYCIAGVFQPTPCPIGTFGATMKLISLAQCTTCTKGSFCAEPGIQVPTGLCNPGFYCNAGSIIPEQNDCPAGSYCEQGSFEGTPCPAGYYNSKTNMKTFQDCALCTPGQYCDGTATTSTSGLCNAGWYCLSGSRVIDQYAARPGYYTLAGAAAEVPCPAKKYNPLYYQSACIDCPAGFYCDKTAMAEPTICPIGKYCELGSETPVQCPVGTYNPVTGGTSIATHCLKCPPGRYCQDKGLSAPSGDCAAGYFCLESAETSRPAAEDLISGRWGKCTRGNYCPVATSYPYPCPAGTFSNSEKLTAASECTPCTAGSYCLTRGLTVVTEVCDAGFYCPAGQAEPRNDAYKCNPGFYCPAGSSAQIKCAAGSYQHQYYQESCITCPAGYYCPEQATDPIICPIGAYCMESSTTFTVCPIGKYQPDTGASVDCLACPAGSYCGTTGLSAPSGLCSAGYVCTQLAYIPQPNSASQGGYKCQQGYYCPQGSGFQLQCPPGKACPNTGMTDTDIAGTAYDCSAGYYCLMRAIKTNPLSEGSQGGDSCTTGHYCPQGTSVPIPCPPGTYNGLRYKSALTDCLPCPAGSYCQHYGSTTYKTCDEGWYCETTAVVGEVSPTPWDAVANAPKVCPVGHFCTSGIKAACSSKYQDQKGQNSCKTCIAGYKCTTSQLIDCGQSNYCPSNDMNPTKCAAGYYTLKTNAISPTECIICPAGSWCTCTYDATNSFCVSNAQITQCADGKYCAEGSSNGNTPCSEGYYCPMGTFEEIPCTPGYMCDGTGNSPTTLVDCPAGYYCTGGTTSGTKKPCQAGYYCPINSRAQIPCEIGTYNPSTLKSAVADCLACPQGSTCTKRAQVADDISGFTCEAGYYCKDDKSKDACPKGYYCVQDSAKPTECPVGTYTDNLAQTSCAKCPAGYYCGDDIIDDFFSSAVKIVPDSAILCVAGQYCPKGSYLVTAASLPGISCPVGTFNPDLGARNVGDCIDCPEGYLCTTLGLADDYALLTKCPAGSYCPGAAISKSAIDCPIGAYCPEGSVTFIQCPVGTYQSGTMKTLLSDCVDCPLNYYCGSKGIGDSTTLPLCGDGYICLGGTAVSTPLSTQKGDFCPTGKYCSRLALGAQDCPIGKYQPNKGGKTCIDCPAGQLCDTTSMTVPNTCPVGKYCPAQTNSVSNAAIDCPAGSYNEIENIGASSMCTPCEPGKYCLAGSVAKSSAIDCDATFFCPRGAAIGNTYTDAYTFGSTTSGLCPAGHTCAAGTLAPEPCPVGYYNPLIGQTVCVKCLAGYYCNRVGMSSLTVKEKCDAGYYCLEGSHIPNPQDLLNADGTVKTASTIGQMCKKGTYCPVGSAQETKCAAGTYETRDGSAECQQCPAGYYCLIGSFKPIECEKGYCPAGSAWPTDCPAGTYGNEALKKLEDASDCPMCPNGQFCHSGKIQGTCDAGYFCDFGAEKWQDENKICPSGHYCPAGTKLPIRCPETLYYASTGARDVSFCTPCQAGYYCLDNDSVSRVCPKGHFCPEKTKEPIPCWQGTYNPLKRAQKSDDCKKCPAGSSCNKRGIDDYIRHVCPIGHYCPNPSTNPIPCPAGTYRNSTGAQSMDQCWQCPAGFYCEQGASFAIPCDAGYQCKAGSTQQVACPPGTYCPAMSEQPLVCPQGYMCPSFRTDLYTKCRNGTYCGPGSKKETSCDPGEFGTGQTFNWNKTKSCIPCGPGQYSDAKSKTCQPCEQGYICQQGATTSRPNSPQEKGQICDPGYYCLKGALSGIACPVGTYSPEKGNGQLNQCKPCPANTYGVDVGQTSCIKCAEGTVSEIGSTTCRCAGLNRKYLADVKSCVCMSGFEPVDGDTGNKNGFSDCQKIVFTRCKDGEERDVNGKCRSKTDCAAECNGGTGTIQQNFGICQCDDVVTPAQICNADCQKNALVTSFTSEGKVRTYDPAQKKFLPDQDMPDTIGSAKCSAEDVTKCELVGVGMSSSSSGAFAAGYDLPKSLTQNNKALDAANKRAMNRRKSNNFKGTKTYSQNNTTMYWEQDGRNLQAQAEPDAAIISNPVICTRKGSALLFDSLSEDNYPVYQRNSLLNTNQNFDYGQFDALPTLLKGKTNQNFIFTFNQAGIYVFADSRNPAKLMLVSVMKEEFDCPADSRFSPMTYASLLKVGAFQAEVLLEPEWAFFFSTLISFILLIVIAVLLVSWIARRDWKQKYLPKIIYQRSNYKAVDRDDPNDTRAIVSINTDSSSFMFRAQGQADAGGDMGEQLVNRMKTGKGGNANKVAQQQKGPRGRKDLSLNQVETLKDSLHKHLKEIKKLRALRYGKDGSQIQDELGNEQSDYTSSDEDELNTTIANVRKLIENARAVLRGEGEEEIQIFTADTKMIEAINSAEDKRAQREEAIRLRKEKLEEEQRIQDEQFKRKLNRENELAVNDLQDMKNRVLEMQVESAYDRGKAFQERMLRSGHNNQEINEMMSQLEGKMQRVEDLLVDDKDRQNEMLKRQMEQRRQRRRKLNEKMIEIDEQLHKGEYQQADLKTIVVQQLQTELKGEMEALEQEDKLAREEMTKKYEAIKQERLADYQDRLRNAGSTLGFQTILADYQQAQIVVDKELARQINKENDRLNRDLKQRKAKVKAQAEIRRNQRFKELEVELTQKMNDNLDGKAKLEEALSTDQRKEEIVKVFGARLKSQINEGNLLATEMERKRREEESLRQEHERKVRKVQAEALKEASVLNKDVDEEIERIANADSFEPFQALVNERSLLQKQIAAATDDSVKELLLKQLKEVDEQVKNQLGQEAKDQDMALKRKLDTRRFKRETAINLEKRMKQGLLQERIVYALENSTNFFVYRNDLTHEALHKIVSEMKLQLAPEEIPAALELLIDDKHQKELADWLLKLYEQKAIELKEEILTLMEEKIAKQQVLKKNFEDRQRGINAILLKTTDYAAISELNSRKDKLKGEMISEVNRLETDFIAAETIITREIQARSMDRETKALQEMSELHLQEKSRIFEQFLPDSLMKSLFEELSTKERHQMDLYQKELEAAKQQRLLEMAEQERVLKAELANQQSLLNKMSEEEQVLAKKEFAESRRQQQNKREKQAVVSSKDVITKIRQDMEKGLEGLSGAYEEEHKRQLAIMEARLASRGQQVTEALEQKKLETLRKQEQAEFERMKEIDKVRECRKRKTQLLQTIEEGQKLMLKGCYSRPLWNYNKKLHDAAVKSDDIGQLLHKQSLELKEQVMGRLLNKVSELEDKVRTDVSRKPERAAGGVLGRVASRSGLNDASSNNGSDKSKLSNAKALLSNLFKRKI